MNEKRKTRLHEAATQQDIIRFFEKDLQWIEEDDGLLIFFAGHGITVASASAMIWVSSNKRRY